MEFIFLLLKTDRADNYLGIGNSQIVAEREKGSKTIAEG